MKRPSRGERWSETTTRQKGFFLLPTLVSRTRTDMGSRRLTTAGQLLQGGHLALRELAHQLLHLPELLDELSDGLNRRPRALGDPPPARAVDQLRVRPLLRGHREDDRLEAVQLLVAHLQRAELLPHAG